ncbi:MAG: zinc ribbon domain-containing protein, partial [Xenococcaceae cyanobacterium MO_167.B52]|nr:zinc ribbon domain-containing protein [Xenococcaceae cyanobacterium MO_167.B52]
MIVCPNCNHQNPEGSIQCESCYTPLPSTAPCPNCGASVQTDATFCGQCGFNLEAEQTAKQEEWATNPFSMIEENLSQENTIPTAVGTTPIVSPWDQDTEETEDITLGEAISFDDTEIMNPSESASVSETSWELELPQTEKMPWENSDLESNAEIPELLDVNASDLEIPELPELNLELSEEDVVEEVPELPELNLELSEEDVVEEVPELPELNLELSEEDVIESISDSSELNLELSEEDVIESISDSSELNLELSEEDVIESISDSS